MDNDKIFVGIAAYNEIDLIQTINSCLDNSVDPSKIYFGVWAHYNKISLPNLDIPNVKYIYCNYPRLLGVCSGRINAMSLYSGEKYYLQIDAHMLFEKDWDLKVVSAYEKIKKDWPKPLITTYVPWWSRNEDGSINFYSPDSEAKTGPMEYDLSILNEGYPKQKTFGVDWSQFDYFEHCGFSAHFAFSSADFMHDVLPDPLFAFGGEEPTTALRAWSQGYKMFAIPNPIAWHKNKFHGVNHEFDRLNYVGEPNISNEYHIKDFLGQKRSIDILTGRILGYWGASSLESLKSYQFFAKTDFSQFVERNSNVRV